MPPKKPQVTATEQARTLVPRPYHMEGQGLVKIDGPDEARRSLMTIPLGADNKVCIFGRGFPSREDWRLHRFRRAPDGEWVRDLGSGLRLDPTAIDLFRDGLIAALQEFGTSAPLLSFAYLADRFERETEAGDASAIIPHLVLRALSFALGTSDRDALGAFGRDALNYVRTRRPGYVAPGDGDGRLDRKGDGGRNPGKNRLLRTATELCRELDANTDYELAAQDLAWIIQVLHRESFDAACAIEARRVPADQGPATVRLQEHLERDLERSSQLTPESVARLALSTFGVPATKVKHYFDYRYAGVDRASSTTINIPGGDRPVPAYIAHPARSRPITRAVIVVPEMYGVTDHVQQVARDLAAEGFLAVVPHLLHRRLPPEAPMEVERRFAKEGRGLDAAAMLQDLGTIVVHLERHRKIPADRVGLLGFGAGGALVHRFAGARVPSFGAAVAFYGIDDVTTVGPHVPLLCVLGDQDILLYPSRREALQVELAARNNGSRLEIIRGAGRGFFDMVHGNRPRGEQPSVNTSDAPGYFNLRLARYYDSTGSAAAWQQTLAFLNGHIPSSVGAGIAHGDVV